MKKKYILVYFACFWASEVVGQCLTPTLIDYTAPTVIGNTSYLFKFNSTDGTQLWKGDTNFENQVFVKNIGGDDISGSEIESFVEMNGTAFFKANGPDGAELWKSDGTVGGTVQVKDIYPGIGYSVNSSTPTNLTNVNGTLFFSASDGTPYVQMGLWRSDGTNAGTVKIVDMYVEQLIKFNNMLYFIGSTGQGLELWRSDGTAAGTVKVKNFAGTGYSPTPKYLTVVGNTLYFSNVSQLWKSDGTAAGTVMVKQINSNSEMFRLYNFNGTLFFIPYDGTTGAELWKSDGTAAGTVLVKDIYIGLTSSGPAYLTEVNGTLYFTAKDATYGTELWKTDGTEAGTMMVKEIYPGAINYSVPSKLINVNGTLFFSAKDNATNGIELWKSDGTAAGTVMIKDIYISGGDSGPTQFKNINGTLYFMAQTYEQGYELWKTDGTAAGTVMIKDINKGSASANITDYINTTNGIILTADDGVVGRELWKTDGTANGTQLLKNIKIFYEQDKIIETGVVNGQLVFTLELNDYTFGLFKSDGTDTGTMQLNNTINNIYSTDYQLTAVNNQLFFTADNSVNGIELWKTDGTVAGTNLVKDIYPASTSTNIFPNYQKPLNLTNINGTLFFSANDPLFGQSGQELWKSDGTTAGTIVVKDILTGSSYSSYYNQYFFKGSNPKKFTNVNNTLYFTAYNESGEELWKSDGTVAGTVQVKDIYTGNTPYFPYEGNSSSPQSLTNVNGILFFSAEGDLANRRELWKSDGTAAGTVMVKNIATANATSSEPNYLNNINGTLFFVADDKTHGTELWRSDGTEAGTSLVMDFKTGSLGGNFNNVFNFNGVLYFMAYTNSNLWELWQSDGTVAGTSKVNTSPYVNYDYYLGPNSFKNVNENLFFKSRAIINNAFVPDRLFRLTNGSSLIITSNPISPINSGTSITLTVTNCTGGVVSWNNGLGTGTTKTVSPTLNTVYTATCTTIGCPASITITIIPCPATLNLISTADDIATGTITKQANNTNGRITATNKITGTAKVTYQAKNIQLNAGFKADNGTVFKAEVGGCQ